MRCVQQAYLTCEHRGVPHGRMPFVMAHVVRTSRSAEGRPEPAGHDGQHKLSSARMIGVRFKGFNQ
jgi:hypothetical protein